MIINLIHINVNAFLKFLKIYHKKFKVYTNFPILSMSIITAIVLCAICLIFLPQLLNIFGCTEVLKEYALNYGYVIVLGLPFMMIGTTLNSMIRADGNPKYAMSSMVIGAILNIILDPIFIFVFDMGVKGAAIATVISQIVTAILNILYIRKFKSVKINKETLKPEMKVALKVSGLGISSFITQMSIVLVMAVENNLLSKYGADSKFGSEIPITVLGIVMKISQILNSIIIGVAAGAQPIVGYNYGAQKNDRVKETLKTVLKLSIIVSTIAFILFQTIPNKLIGIFGSGDDNYIEFACLSFRIFLMLCVFNGLQIPTSIFFQAVGKSAKSALLSLSRQILFLIPGMIILGKTFGIKGVLYAGPVADGLAFVFAIILLIREVRSLNNNKAIDNGLKEEININGRATIPYVITISREYGSGGRYVGKLIADNLGLKLYDKEFIEKLAEKTGLSTEYIENNEQKRRYLDTINDGYYSTLSNADNLFIEESNLIKEVASKEACVIVGRCADFILKDMNNVINIFIYSNMEDKIKRATEFYNMNPKDAEKEIKRINKLRSNHYKYYTGNNWKEPENYDLCINSDTLGVEKTADLICNVIQNRILAR